MKKLRQRSAVRVNSWFTWKAVNSGVGTDRRNSFLFLCWDGNQRRFASWWHDTRNVAKPIMKVTIIKVTAVFFRATNVTFHRFIQESKLDKKCRSGKKAASARLPMCGLDTLHECHYCGVGGKNIMDRRDLLGSLRFFFDTIDDQFWQFTIG